MKYVYDIKKVNEKSKVLNDNEIEELKSNGLEKTILNNLFKCPSLKSNKSVFFIQIKPWLVLYNANKK